MNRTLIWRKYETCEREHYGKSPPATHLVIALSWQCLFVTNADRRIILTGYRLADLLTWVRARPLRSGPPSPRL
jgi:hypothetical protein